MTKEIKEPENNQTKPSGRRGGRRPNSGRKKGSLTVRTREIVAGAAAAGITPLEFLLQVLRDETKPFEDRFKAAVQAAPYIHPRLSQVDGTVRVRRDVSDMSDAELAAIAAGRGDGASSETLGPAQLGAIH